jgi:hypothetical protein
MTGMQGLFSGLLGGGGNPFGGGMLDEFLTPDMKQRMAQQQMMGMAQGLLQAGGPSRMPVSFGQAMGQGLQGAQQAGQGQQDDLIKQLTLMATLKKANETDITQLGEKAYMKAAQGLELNPQETAALRYLDNKQQTNSFNPVTGVMEQKPSLLSRSGINLDGGQPPMQPPGPYMTPKPALPGGPPPQMPNAGMPPAAGIPQPVEEPSEWDIAFQNELKAAEGNPKLQQSIKEKYAAAKISMTESESKNAGYADRFRLSESILTDEDKIAAYSSPLQQGIDWINPFGDQFNSDEYRSYNQARKNATTAKLRQESGAVINPSEFKTDDETLYPQVNDSADLIEQKRQNREAVIKSLSRAAGPAYKPMQRPTVGAARGTANAAPITKPNQAAIDFLTQNPQFAPQFEKKYGISAANYLGLQR